MNLFVIIFLILFPHDPVRRMIEHTRFWIMGLIDSITRDGCAERMAADPHDPEGFLLLERWIDDIEAITDWAIHLRARQILGLIFYGWPPPTPSPLQNCRARSVEELLWRFERAVDRFAQIERLALLRAPRLRRMLEADPLGLAPLHPIEAVVRAFSDALARISAPFSAIFDGARPFMPEHIRAPP
jgi:hypothetical protein